MTADNTPPNSIDTRRPAAGFFDAAESRLLDIATDTKTGLVRSMDGLVIAAHRIAADIDTLAGPSVGDLARSAADVLGNIQRGLDEKSLNELIDEGQDLIRRQPVLALGVAVVSGYAIARLARTVANPADDNT
ncbi:hypothetical protein [Polymorphobacter sp.]|uniref:hypothetical protein n=1 Tax=Polymorphobacter sp. TaxID=1909290 RepID=UPI003F70C0FC